MHNFGGTCLANLKAPLDIYYCVTLLELMVLDGCTDDFHLVELIGFSSEWGV